MGNAAESAFGCWPSEEQITLLLFYLPTPKLIPRCQRNGSLVCPMHTLAHLATMAVWFLIHSIHRISRGGGSQLLDNACKMEKVSYSSIASPSLSWRSQEKRCFPKEQKHTWGQSEEFMNPLPNRGYLLQQLVLVVKVAVTTLIEQLIRKVDHFTFTRVGV